MQISPTNPNLPQNRPQPPKEAPPPPTDPYKYCLYMINYFNDMEKQERTTFKASQKHQKNLSEGKIALFVSQKNMFLKLARIARKADIDRDNEEED